MVTEVFLKQVRKKPGVWSCSICREEFAISPVGPRKAIERFGEHIQEKHPNAILRSKREGFNQAVARIVREITKKKSPA
ncbi:MAG: hypothetical protein LAN63_16070 [Acidobacteriia bacterium]|nr:hypothetical protein [Terriglobia bacterium]